MFDHVKNPNRDHACRFYDGVLKVQYGIHVDYLRPSPHGLVGISKQSPGAYITKYTDHLIKKEKSFSCLTV